MKRIILSSCMVVLLHALTGCCSCCDMNRGAQCYSNCVPCNNGCSTGGGPLLGGLMSGGLMSGGGCCGDSMDYSLPPSPYATQQFASPNQRFSQHVRIRQRSGGPAYSTAPYVDMGNGTNGGMYESFGSEVVPDMGTPSSMPTDSGWQPKSANPMPAPSAVPDPGPNAYYTPSPIPAISASQGQVPPPPGSPSPAQPSNNLVGPDMGPTPAPAPAPVSQMGYRRQVPIQRAF
jgi:hypothetical protein